MLFSELKEKLTKIPIEYSRYFSKEKMYEKIKYEGKRNTLKQILEHGRIIKVESNFFTETTVDYCSEIEKKILDSDEKGLRLEHVHLPFDSLIFMPKNDIFLEKGGLETSDNISGISFLKALFVTYSEVGIDFFVLNKYSPKNKNEEESLRKEYPEYEVEYFNFRNNKISYNQDEKYGFIFLRNFSRLLLEDICYVRKMRRSKRNIADQIEVNRGVNEIIRVKYPRKVIIAENQEPLFSFHFTHQFEVMGHWRRISGIGKDNLGHRGIMGKTWITPHRRGPQDAPFKKQIREFYRN